MSQIAHGFRLWTFVLLSVIYCTFASADVKLSLSIKKQLPPIAYVNKPYSFTISRDTFQYFVPNGSPAPSSPPSLAYNVSNLPQWLSFDPISLTFSGKAPDQAAGQTFKVQVSAATSQPQASASTTFALLALNEPEPTVQKPIVNQFPSASSLGSQYMIAPDTIHIPPGWSFSIGFLGNTFAISTGAQVFWSAIQQNGQPLPSWLQFDSNGYDFYGVAPTTFTGQKDEIDIVIVGSNRPNYGGVTQTFKLVIADHALSLSGGLSAVNASVGNYMSFQVSTSGFKLDGQQQIDPANISAAATLTPDLSSWLSFNRNNRTFSGIPPYSPYGNATSTTVIRVPVIFMEASGSQLTVNQTISIFPSIFTALELPNVVLPNGESKVSVSLKQFLLNSTNSNNNRRDLTVLAASSPNISATFTPQNASSWLSYNTNQLLLTGNIPKGWTDRIKIDLASAQSHASFYLSFASASTVGGKGNNAASGNSSGKKGGLNPSARVAIGATFGAIAGLAAMIILFKCCQRRYDEDYIQRRAEQKEMRQRDDSTLNDGSSDTKKSKAIVIGRAGIGTPSTMAPSPLPYANDEKDLHSIVVVSPNGQRREAIGDSPKQSRLISNLFHGGQRKANSKRIQEENSRGLGLSMNESSDQVDPFQDARSQSIRQIHHQRSRETIGSHHSSWESDLFYENAVGSQQHLDVPGDDEPRRRGKAATNGLNVRQRSAHNNQSPAFNADAFPPSSGTDRDLAAIGLAAADSELSVNSSADGLQASSTGNLSAPQEDARILKARVMQVQRHSPILHQGIVNPFAHSAGQTVRASGGAFEDAREEEEVNQRTNNRISAMSAMTDGSHFAGIRAHMASEAAMEAEAAARVASPNPSFMDGVSVSGFEPQDSVKAVARGRPLTPQMGNRPEGPRTPKSSGAASGKYLACPRVDAYIGNLLRFKLYPSVPPPLAGAAGSPGKRSGRSVRYDLVLNDSRPHLLKFKGEWPDMLADWLTIDTTTFEVEGVVPHAAELAQLGDIEIALQSTTRISGNSHSPDRSSKRYSIAESFDSNAATIRGRKSMDNDEEQAIVARARLVFQKSNSKKSFTPRHGQAF